MKLPPPLSKLRPERRTEDFNDEGESEPGTNVRGAEARDRLKVAAQETDGRVMPLDLPQGELSGDMRAMRPKRDHHGQAR